MKQYTYYFLASPYQGDVFEKTARYNMSKKIAATFLDHGISVFAPILYNQALIDYFEDVTLEKRRELLMPMNMDFLANAQGMLLLKTQGWDSSWGIQKYLDYCSKNKIKIYDLTSDNLDQSMNEIIKEINSE